MAKINFDKHIYEGWTVRDFIEELEPQLDMIQTGNSCYRPMKTRAEIRNWTADNQPYYKKPVTDGVVYFCMREIAEAAIEEFGDEIEWLAENRPKWF